MAKKRADEYEEQNIDIASIMANVDRGKLRSRGNEDIKSERPNYTRFSKEKVIEEILDSTLNLDTKMIIIRYLVKAK